MKAEAGVGPTQRKKFLRPAKGRLLKKNDSKELDEDMAFKQKQKEQQKALEASKNKASQKGKIEGTRIKRL